MSRGEQSPWSAYLALLAKRPPQMATSLSKDSREMLKYCEAYNDIESDINDMQEDYDSVLVPFVEKYPEVFTKDIKDEFFSLEAFKTMTGHVSSRSMDVDNFHISALVPFADFVNHSPTPNSDYLTHEDVCETCGALACEHLESEDEDEDMESDSDEAPDLGGDDEDDDDEAPQLASEKEPASKKFKKNDEEMDEDEEWEDDEDDEDEDDDDGMVNDTCDIILDYEVKKGQEITRHYGPYPNKIILSKYGFAVEDNPHDTVTIQLEMVRQAASKFLKDEAMVEERIQWFLASEDVFIGADDGDDHEHGGGCCGGGGHSHNDEEMDEHDHSRDRGCCDSKNSKKNKNVSDLKVDEEDQDDDSEMDEDEEEEEEDFPRDIMYMMHDGSIDDRLLLLLNVLFMEKTQFKKANEDMDVAMEYFNDIFVRRQQEEQEDEDDDMEEEDEEEGEKIPKPELKPRDAKSKKVRKAVLEAILELIRIRADAFGVTHKTTAEQDLASLKKAKLSGPLYYGGLCVQGEKQILQNGLQGYKQFLSEL
ncbi:hypothetical protein BGX27_000264 [Mortierella sp. AM989]|nr:hypothetical protein BGX27_000264 [Mortierella sp. AM989]